MEAKNVIKQKFVPPVHLSIAEVFMALVKEYCTCVPQVWAAIPPWKQGSLAEFVALSANEVLFWLLDSYIADLKG